MKKKIVIILVALTLSYSVNGMSKAAFFPMEEVLDFEEEQPTVSQPQIPQTENQTEIPKAESQAELQTTEEQSTEIEQMETTDEEQEITQSEIKEKTVTVTSPNIPDIYQVSFPANTTAYLDPDNLSGQGQVFSEHFKVENYSNRDVVIKIKKVEIYYQNTESEYEFSTDEISDHHSRIKRLDLNVVWENEEGQQKVMDIIADAPEQDVLFLEAAQYDENGEFVNLGEGGTGSFYFTGTMNSNPDLVWENGEIMTCFQYEIVDNEKTVLTDSLE